MSIVGIGEIGTATQGTGDVRVVFNIAYLGEGQGGSRNKFGRIGGGGTVRFVYSIEGISELGEGVDGAGSIGTVLSIIGSAELSTSEHGVGFVKHNLSLTGNGEIGQFNYVSDPNLAIFSNKPSNGDVRIVYSVDGSGDTGSDTEGTGVVGFGTLIAKGEIGTSVEGTGEVELIPNLTATATQATLEQINTELQVQLQKTVSVTFDSVAYDQRADHLTLFAMKDIKDNWANYSDLKNGSDIEWGVDDGTILTMTQAEFTTYYNDTMAAWRDRADRVIQKARDWSDTGVALATIQDDSNWA